MQCVNHILFQIAKCTMKKNANIEEFFNKVCLEQELTSSEHFLRVKKKKEMPDSKFFVPQRTDLIDNYVSPIFVLFFLLFFERNNLTENSHNLAGWMS